MAEKVSSSADVTALSAGESAALHGQPRTACPYSIDTAERLALLWVRGYAYGLAILRGRPV